MICRSPVAFFVFNRPSETERVFERIAAARPRQLLVVADGPRAHVTGEAENVAAVRRIVGRVDWPCELLKDYSASNLGCRARISSGLKWVFDAVPEAVILEDDCIPDESFFPYCDELLARYRDDRHVSTICGSSFTDPRRSSEYSYFFSKYFIHCWGWASWRRTFETYDVSMRAWADVRPGRNLISNVGFGSGATHTLEGNSGLANRRRYDVGRLVHPPRIARDKAADRFMFETAIGGRRRSLLRKWSSSAAKRIQRLVPAARLEHLGPEPGTHGTVRSA